MTDRYVFFGSSNATMAAGPNWTLDFANQMGAEHHNFAIGGGGLAADNDARFHIQFDNANKTLTDEEKKTTTIVWVVDLLNDIRGNLNVEADAKKFFTNIRNTFPNARIIFVPVLYNWSMLNRYTFMALSVWNRTNEAMRGAEGLGVEIVNDSWTWFHDGPAQSVATDEAGGGVHFTHYGYARVRDYLYKYLKGSSVQRNCGWEAPYQVYSQFIGSHNLHMRRLGGEVTLFGQIVPRQELKRGTLIGHVQGWGYPYEEIIFNVNAENGTTGMIKVDTEGHIWTLNTFIGGLGYHFNARYHVF